MLHLAEKAFYPAPPPFPLLHVDTTWKFRDDVCASATAAADPAIELIVHTNPEAVRRASARSTTAPCTPT